jgi:hypothetical protein
MVPGINRSKRLNREILKLYEIYIPLSKSQFISIHQSSMTCSHSKLQMPTLEMLHFTPHLCVVSDAPQTILAVLCGHPFRCTLGQTFSSKEYLANSVPSTLKCKVIRIFNNVAYFVQR